MATSKQQTKTVTPPPAKTDGGPQQSDTALANVPTATSLTRSAMPAFLQKKMEEAQANGGPRGLENADKDDFIYPRLVLGQSNSPAVQDSKRAIGEIFDNLNAELLAPKGGKVLFVPVLMTKARMYLVPFEEGGGIKCRSDDSITARPGGIGQMQDGAPTSECAKCVHKEFDTTEADQRPACSNFVNIIGILPEYGNRVIVWSVKSTGLKVARRLMSTVKQTGADFFAHAFYLLAEGAQNQAGVKYQAWNFETAGWASEEAYTAGEELYQAISGKKWAVSTADLENAQPADTSFPPADDVPEQTDAGRYEEALDKAAIPQPKPAAKATPAPAAKQTVDAKVTKPAPAKAAPSADDDAAGF